MGDGSEQEQRSRLSKGGTASSSLTSSHSLATSSSLTTAPTTEHLAELAGAQRSRDVGEFRQPAATTVLRGDRSERTSRAIYSINSVHEIYSP